jgi:O-antigen ligase
VGVVVVLASGLIAGRIAMSFEAGHTPDTGRLEMASVGVRMMGDHPIFGVGPERVGAEFPAYYRGDDLENLFYGHLHNNFLQIGAERGIPALLALVWFFGRIALDLFGGTRYFGTRWVSVSGLAVLTAFLTAGLFEYNFGDSEVLMLFMFLVSIPYGMKAIER